MARLPADVKATPDQYLAGRSRVRTMTEMLLFGDDPGEGIRASPSRRKSFSKKLRRCRDFARQRWLFGLSGRAVVNQRLSQLSGFRQ